MSRLLNPTHPNPLILLLHSCLADWSSDRYFFSLAQPRTLAQQLFITAGPSLETSLLPTQLRLIVVWDLLSCKWLCCVHKRYHVHPCDICLLHSCYRMNKLFLIHLDPFFTTSSGYLRSFSAVSQAWFGLLLSHIHLTSLSLTVQKEGAKEPLIFGRHNVQGERNRGAHGTRGAAITAQAHQRIPQQMSLNKMAARSA